MEFFLLVLIIGLIFALFMAWSIGANDVANSMGTSVGSKAVTVKQAVILAAIFEFMGAFFVGAKVTSTVRKGIVPLEPFQALSNGPELLALGMACALLGAALWLVIATYFCLPVSTTHSIVGAVIGFGIITIGVSNIEWEVVIKIVLSWIISPIGGALVAFFMFLLIKKSVLEHESPIRRAKKIGPVLVIPVGFVIAFFTVFKGLKHAEIQFEPLHVVLFASLLSLGLAYFVRHLFTRYENEEGSEETSEDESGEEVSSSSPGKEEKGVEKDECRRVPFSRVEKERVKVEKVFAYLQVFTACYIAFAHGANDVANATGPLAAVVSISLNPTHSIESKAVLPMWVLFIGGIGIVIGLATWGYRVMATIGKRITEITPTRGFSAEFATATAVLMFSEMGMPISTTHTLVGSVIGVGLAGGVKALDFRVVKNIIYSWLITVPAGMFMTMVIFIGARALLGV